MKKIITTILIIACIISNSYSQWTQINMPGAKGQLQAAKKGDTIYFIGGCDGSFNITSTVYAFNTASATWLPGTNLSSPRCFTASVAGDSALYVAGGLTSWSTMQGCSIVDIYKKGVWSTHTLPDSISFAQAVHVGNKILIGGSLKKFNASSSTLVASNKVYVYDELTNVWAIDTLSQARTFTTAVTDGVMAIFAGGCSGFNTVSNVVDIYNSVSNTWTTATLSSGRSLIGSAYANGVFYFAGGAGAGINNSSNVVDIYDGTDWGTTQLHTARSNIAACSAGDKVFFTGGGNINALNLTFTSITSDVDIYNIAPAIWSFNNMNYAKVTHAAIGSGNKIYVAGGIAGSTVLNFVEIWDITSGIHSVVDCNNFEIFPNPTRNKIEFSVPEKSIIEILDLQGQMIKTLKTLEAKTHIDVSELPGGVYLVKVKTENGVRVKKFIKE
jgi:hypothetical protein